MKNKEIIAKEIDFNKGEVKVKDFFSSTKDFTFKTYPLYSVLVGKHRFTLYPDQLFKWMKFWEIVED